MNYLIRTVLGTLGPFSRETILAKFREGEITDETLSFAVEYDSPIKDPPPMSDRGWKPLRMLLPEVLEMPKPPKGEATPTPANKPSACDESPLDGVIITFNRDFPQKDSLVRELLNDMPPVLGHPYQYWVRDYTPIRIRVNPNITRDFHAVLASACIEFGILLGNDFAIENVKTADFDASQGISGVILSHWNAKRNGKKSEQECPDNKPVPLESTDRKTSIFGAEGDKPKRSPSIRVTLPPKPSRGPQVPNQIFLAKPGGEKQGPFALEEIKRQLAAKAFTDEGFWAWYDGLKEWIPLYSVPGLSGSKIEEGQASRAATARSGKYGEKDNRGTLHDSLDIASSYWFARLSAAKKDPFVIHTFDTERDARAALLELPCIHVAQDTQRLICTEVLIFGCYRTQDGKYEAVICGDDLTFELWEQARASFTRHGGRPKNEKSPERQFAASRAASQPKLTSSAQVTFLNEYQARNQMGQVCTYSMYRGPSSAVAKEFLAQKPVTRNFHYIVVETPEGNYGHDIDGIYKE